MAEVVGVERRVRSAEDTLEVLGAGLVNRVDPRREDLPERLALSLVLDVVAQVGVNEVRIPEDALRVDHLDLGHDRGVRRLAPVDAGGGLERIDYLLFGLRVGVLARA